jgi:hypothetical protein
LTDSTSNPLVEYNTTFKQLQFRLRFRPLVGSWPESYSEEFSASAPAPDIPLTINAPLQDIPPTDFEDLASESSDNPEDMEQPSAFLRTMEEDDEPTLTRNTAADVSLDMQVVKVFCLRIQMKMTFILTIDNSDDDYVDD